MTSDRVTVRRTGARRRAASDRLNLCQERYGSQVPADDESSGAEGYPPILTTAQAAELLQVHVEYLRKMVREGRIPAHRFPQGREIRLLRDELIAWVQEQPGHDRSPAAGERVET
jgi:excisionase family DNA binding protein